jgi:hypothetical protein
MKTISETKLIIPVLSVLSQHEDLISSKQLKNGILKMVKVKKSDLQNVEGRTTTIINSRIDNLISHRTLNEFVIYTKIVGKVYLQITDKGRTYLSKKILAIV